MNRVGGQSGAAMTKVMSLPDAVLAPSRPATPTASATVEIPDFRMLLFLC
jgi:hypothetical protein